MWFRSFFNARESRSRRQPSGTTRLWLEPLEDRSLPAFVAPLSFDVGRVPQSVAAADFNGDGRPDLAVVGHTLTVLLGNGDGTFQEGRHFGEGGQFVTVEDFNGDGHLDLAMARSLGGFEPGAVNVLLGNGDGTFQAARSFTVGRGPESVAVGEFNGDGRLDLVVANHYSADLSVLLGNGDGSFQAARTVFPGGQAVAVGEFNGDGRADLVTGASVFEYDPNTGETTLIASGVSVLLGNGDGTFGSTGVINTEGGEPESVAVADVNGDGRLDIAAAGNGTVSMLLSNGDGSFQAPRSFPSGGVMVYDTSMAVADVNYDGRPDIAVSSTTGAHLLLGNGDGSLQAARPIIGKAPLSSTTLRDVNGDGRTDLAVTDSTFNTVSVLLGNGDGTFRNNSNRYAAGSHPVAAAVADVNGDSRPDLTVANPGSNDVSVLLGNGDGSFQDARNFAVGTGFYSVAVGDVNGDGRPDIVTANLESNDVSVLLGNGDGSFQAARNFPAGLGPKSVAVGDFNADGRLDLAATGFGFEYDEYGTPIPLDQTVRVLLGNGDGTFQAVRSFPAGWEPTSVAVADLNVDGRPDLTVMSRIGVSVLLGNGDGNFQTARNLGAGSSPLAVADFNSDGRPDLAVTSGIGVSVLLGNGDGTFQPARELATGYTPQSFAVTDVNRDSRLDLVVTAGSEHVLFGNGDGTFQTTHVSYVAGGGGGVAAVGDFNRDGWADVAAPNGSDVAILLNDGIWDVPPPPPPPLPSISINDRTVTEGNAGTQAVTFTVTLSAASSQPVSVAYATGNGTASAGSDYQGASGTLTIPAGQVTGTITVPVNGDRLGEANESFVVNLSSPTNATIADGQGAGTILDDEPRVSISDVTKVEGKKNQTTMFTFTVTLSAAYDQAVTMSFRTADGTAKTSDGDYVAKTGTLTFAPGETTKTITIEVKGDSKRESNETFYLDLFGNSSNSLFTKNRGIGTILNDD